MYDAASSLVGYAPIRAGWQAALTQHGVTDATAILASYDRWCRAYHLDPNLAVAQACLECAWFQDWKWVQLHNPCGLGSTSRDVPGAAFASADDGIRAQCEHLCAYAYTIAECPVDHAHMVDPRHYMHLGNPVIGGLNGHWAVPGASYAQNICAIANAIGGTPVAEYPTEADIGAPIRLETTDFVGPERALADIDWYVIHDTEGHYEGDIAVLTHGSRNGSIHAIIGREPGQFCVSVPIHTTAWAAGNDTLGARAIQVELSKAPTERGYTDTQYQYLAAFVQWCQKQGVTVPLVYLGLHPTDADNGPLLDERGIIGHAGVPDGQGGWGGFAHHTDPGPQFDWPRFIAMLGNGPPPPPSPDQIDGYDVGAGIAQLVGTITDDGSHGRLRLLGTCLGPQHDEYLVSAAPAPLNKRADPVVVVRFERGVLLWDHGRTPDPWSCRAPLATEYVGPGDDPYVASVLAAMRIAHVQ